MHHLTLSLRELRKRVLDRGVKLVQEPRHQWYNVRLEELYIVHKFQHVAPEIADEKAVVDGAELQRPLIQVRQRQKTQMNQLLVKSGQIAGEHGAPIAHEVPICQHGRLRISSGPARVAEGDYSVRGHLREGPGVAPANYLNLEIIEARLPLRRKGCSGIFFAGRILFRAQCRRIKPRFSACPSCRFSTRLLRIRRSKRLLLGLCGLGCRSRFRGRECRRRAQP